MTSTTGLCGIALIIAVLSNYVISSSDLSEQDFGILERQCPNYKRCSNSPQTTPPATDNNTAPSCCMHCSCNSKTCHNLNNCCPDVLSQTAEANDIAQECQATSKLPNNVIVTGSHEEKPENNSSINLGVEMVSGCPSVNPDTRCSTPNSTILDENIPVSSMLSGYTYRNKYCAECNNENRTDLLPWRSYVTCSDLTVMKADDLLFPVSIQKIYSYATNSERENCGFDFLPPSNVSTDVNVCFIDTTLISTCPAEFTNTTLDKLCNGIKLPYLRADQTQTLVYRNYFCYLCNNNNSESEYHCPAKFDIVLHVDSEYVVEVNTQGQQNSEFLPPWKATDLTPPGFIPVGVNCGHMTTFDPFQEKCREWFCPSERKFQNGACAPNIVDVVKATFSINLKMEPDDLSLAPLKAANKTVLTEKLLDEMFGEEEATEKKIIILAIKSNFSYMFASVLITVRQDSIHKAKLYDPLTYGNDVSVRMNGTLLTFKIDFAVGLKIELSTFPLSDIVIIDLIEYIALENIYRANISEIEDSFLYTYISKLAFCSRHLLHRSEIRDYIDVIDIRISDTRLHIGEFSRTSRFDTINVCVSDYLRNAQSYLHAKYKSESYSSQAILSVICNLLSIAGLTFTIVTYMIFDELRSIPGKNNMMLAFHLLIAQCLYQFGMDQTQYHTLCIVLGIFIHMFWLIAIFWMNACTLHMFRTFVTGQSYRSVRACDPQVICYAMYCYGIAITMVAVNIGVSLYRSDGKEVGYGGHVCYISNPVMVGWVFALPVGVIIILNMGFFFAVVYQISASTMRRRGKSTDRANTVIYMKLSSLTGVTWIFGYLYLWTDFAPLEYIFIVLNAGQGVFIFISFICTQRITKLYWNLVRKKCLVAQARACVCCLRKNFEYEGNVVEMNTAKVQMSLTAEITSKKRKTDKRKRVLKLEGANFGSKSDSVAENGVRKAESPSDATNNKSSENFDSNNGVPPCNVNGDGTNHHIQNENQIATVATISMNNVDLMSSIQSDAKYSPT